MAPKESYFPKDEAMTEVAITFRNRSFIADSVLPRVLVGKILFKYLVASLIEEYRMPDTKVGRTSAPNKVDLGWTDEKGKCLPYGLDDDIPKEDLEDADDTKRKRIFNTAVEGIIGYVEADREKRVADIVFNENTYDSTLRATLSGSSQFSDPTSKPIKTILEALDKPILRPNKLVFGQSGWTTFRQHPDIVKATHGNSGDAGVAAREAIAEVFEVEEILVGRGRYTQAKKGGTPTLLNLWGNHLSMIHIPNVISERSSDTFGFTGQWGTRVAGRIQRSDIGLLGGETVRSGEYVDEVISCNLYGYFLKNIIA
jgi:hypothetical protein